VKSWQLLSKRWTRTENRQDSRFLTPWPGVKFSTQTKELATRYERALQESEAVTEKCKNRLDITSEELERVLLQKEGESFKDNTVQPRQGAGGKRAIGKAVAKGGLLLKGKNPGNVRFRFAS
jgi:hypothetical protein